MRRLLLGVYLPLILILLSVLFVVALTLIRNPQIPFYAIGKARLHSDVVNATVRLDGVDIPAKVYSLEDYRRPGEGRQFLVFSPGWNGVFPVTTVDVDRRDIGISNFSSSAHAIFFDRYLVQTDAAYNVVWASNKFRSGYDPKMTVEGNRITYFEEKLIGHKKIEIIFENNL